MAHPFLPRDAMLARSILWPCAGLYVCVSVTSRFGAIRGLKFANLLNFYSRAQNIRAAFYDFFGMHILSAL